MDSWKALQQFVTAWIAGFLEGQGDSLLLQIGALFQHPAQVIEVEEVHACPRREA